MKHHPRTVWSIVAFSLAIVAIGYVGTLVLQNGTGALTESAVRCQMEE